MITPPLIRSLPEAWAKDAFDQVKEMIDGATKGLGETEAIELRTPDGFIVDSVKAFPSGFLCLNGFAPGGIKAARLIYYTQLQLDIFVVPADQKNPRSRRIIGFDWHIGKGD